MLYPYVLKSEAAFRGNLMGYSLYYSPHWGGLNTTPPHSKTVSTILSSREKQAMP